MRQFRSTSIGFAVALVLSSYSALAHEGPHGGSSVEGTVVSVSADGLTVKTERGERRVTFSAKTQVMSGPRKVSREALVPGVHVHAHGSKLPGGGFAAREVMIEDAHERPPTHHDHD